LAHPTKHDVGTPAACDAAVAALKDFIDRGAEPWYERCSSLDAIERFLRDEQEHTLLLPWPRWSNALIAASLLGRDIAPLVADYRALRVPGVLAAADLRTLSGQDDSRRHGARGGEGLARGGGAN